MKDLRGEDLTTWAKGAIAVATAFGARTTLSAQEGSGEAVRDYPLVPIPENLELYGGNQGTGCGIFPIYTNKRVPC